MFLEPKVYSHIHKYLPVKLPEANEIHYILHNLFS